MKRLILLLLLALPFSACRKEPYDCSGKQVQYFLLCNRKIDTYQKSLLAAAQLKNATGRRREFLILQIERYGPLMKAQNDSLRTMLSEMKANQCLTNLPDDCLKP